MFLKRSLGLGVLIHLSTAALIPRQIAHAGQYAIVNCGPENTALLHTLLDELYAALLPAVQDAESAQGPAFQAFFKDTENGASVSNLLASISEGAPAYPPADKVTNGAPAFVCLSGKGQVTGTFGPTGAPLDGFDYCSGSTAAAAMTGTKYIVICPKYWTSPHIITSPPPPPADDQPAPNCLTLSRRGIQFSGTAADRHGAATLVQYKVWILLEELAHAYIYAAHSAGQTPVPETLDIYDAKAAFDLSARDSLSNAPNYVMYVASLYGKCKAFPTSNRRMLLDAGPEMIANQIGSEPNPASFAPTAVKDIILNVPGVS